MYELLIRTETLFLGLNTAELLVVGLSALLIGAVLWLGGTRYSSAIIGLLGAVVGSAAGLMIGPMFDLHPIWSMLIGAVVVAAVSILLKKILILVLAVLVISAVSGAGYLAVVLDRVAPPEPQVEARVERRLPYQAFSAMEPAARLDYMREISDEAETFGEKLDAVLANTWEAIRPHGWMVAIAVVVGAVVGLLLVWFIAKVVIALAYSIVGTATIFIGAQAALLGAGYPAASALDARRWFLPIAFITMTAIGWVWQLFYGGPKPRREPARESEDSD